MSLTNPNKVITEQRLNEYHQTILPYLGGMPDIVASKFDRSDIYSTSERMIGQWTDGKPLYQKTYSFTMPNNATDKVVTTLASECFIIDMQGMINWGTRSFIPISYCSSPSNNIYGFIYVDASSVKVNTTDTDLFSKPAWITIKYTKTTDSAISIGNDTDYSTTEKIVGTWIDGKPLYQKTFTGTTPSSNNVAKRFEIGATISSCIKIDGAIHVGTEYIPLLYYATALDSDNLVKCIKATCNDNNASDSAAKNTLQVTVNNNNWFNMPFYITIQYTKTTD